MTTRPDPDPVISAWLNDEAAERAPEHLLTASRARIQSTNQRRAWRPAWRPQAMNNRVPGRRSGGDCRHRRARHHLHSQTERQRRAARAAIAAPKPEPSPAPSASSTPAPSQAVIPPGQLCSATDCLTGALEAGTYSFDAGSVTPGKLTFMVPAGWTTDKGIRPQELDLQHLPRSDNSPHEVVFVTYFVTTSTPTHATGTQRWSAPERPSISSPTCWWPRRTGSRRPPRVSPLAVSRPNSCVDRASQPRPDQVRRRGGPFLARPGRGQ